MEERQLKNIKRYLQSADVQERIRRYIQRGRSEATVSIGRVAQLFQLKESKLRDWETRGLLKPLRSKDISGQRQYSPTELDKLAIIKELVDEGGYSPSEIAANIEDLWYDIHLLIRSEGQLVDNGEIEVGHLYIDQRVEQAERGAFWRYYADNVLRLSLALICENIPGTVAGLVLPLHLKTASNPIIHPNELPGVGESLVSWQNQNHSFGTFLDPAPSFEYPTDFRVHPLQTTEETISQDSTLIIVQRKAEPLILNKDVVEAIRRLLAPLYQNVGEWRSYFTKGMRDSFYPANGFNSNTTSSKDILNSLADMVVRLGGQTTDGQDRWRFCCILLPKNSILPLQQRSLVVRAQSKYAPHKVGVTTISPQRDKPLIGLSLRAFQSGHIAYRSETFPEDFTIAFSEVEGSIRSAIAVPIGGENGTSVAVLYIVSDGPDAFSQGDQRVLRMMGKMIEEILMTYQARQQITHKLTDIIKKPSVVDTLFEDFLSENEFTRDVMAILTDIQTRMKERRSDEKGELQPGFDTNARIEQLSEEVVSFIAVDIDNQSRLANRYGDRMTRNLSRELGLRIQRELSRLFTEHADCRLYHIYTDRFYLLLKNISLEQARDKAVRLRQILNGFYQIDTLRSSIEETLLPDSMQTLSISVRLGITSYHFTKLEDLLQRYSAASAITKVRNIISNSLDKSLEAGRIEGGDVVMTWDPLSEGSEFIRLTPPKSN